MKYLAVYDAPNNQEQNRDVALAATNKVTYICNAINRAGINVQIISASTTKNRKGCKGKTASVSNGTTVKLFSCWGRGNVIKRAIGRKLFSLKLFWYLLFNIASDETLIVYHSVAYARMVTLLRKLKKFRLVLEIEEIYADVNGKEKDRKKEYRVFAMADAYIFPAEQLNQKINTKGKPYTLICGTYQVEPDRHIRFDSPEAQQKIHCVYAGTFDPRKGGAQMAILAARYLPQNYHMHILGFGSAKDTEETMQLLEQVKKESKCTLTYDGCLQGEEYICFLQSCHIGLSTQNPDAAFNNTSFPSKILSYMANGLQVVTVRIPVVEESTVGQWMHFYNKATPEAIAEAIMGVDWNHADDGRTVIKELDGKFVKNIKALLEG